MWIILFFLTTLSLIFGGHFLLYYTLVKFFRLQPGKKNCLAIVLSLLSISFLLAMLLVRWKETAITKGMYFLSSLWIGTFTYLVIFLFFFWLAYFIMRLMKVRLNWKFMAAVFLVLPLFISTWGVYNAYHPVVRRTPLRITDLPQEWKGKKLLHLSDLHLGLSNGASYLERVVQLSNQERPDVIFITGDLFDGGDGNLEIFAPLLSQLDAPLGTYFVTGNHERYLGFEEVFGILNRTDITVLDDEAVDIQGVRIIGIGYPGQRTNTEIGKTIQSLTVKGRPQLLLFHIPVNIQEFKEAGVDAMFSGHTHQGQLFPFGFITRIVYHGYDRGLNQIGKMQLYVSSGAATWGPPMKTSGRTEIVAFTLE